MCRTGAKHPKPIERARKGKFWRGHRSLALEVGAKQVPQMEAHYRKHGIAVTHRRGGGGKGYVPALASKQDFDCCLEARGLVDKG